MTFLQGSQAPPAPRVDGEAIAKSVEEGRERALTGVDRADAPASVREVINQVRAEIEAARSQGVERITIQPRFDSENIIPPQAVDISIAFFVMIAFIIVGLPLARAFARRMDRRSEPASASEISPRLVRIEQAIEAVAIEVERVSEGQRFTTKAISELRGLPSSNAAAGWPSGAREPERVPLGEAARRP
jgi:hypothetical protein